VTLPPDVVCAALDPFVSDERKAKIEAVLDARLGGLTVVLENLHDQHNGAAAMRSVEGFGVGELHVVEGLEPFKFSSKVTQGCEKWTAVHRYREFAACADALHARGFALWAAVPGADIALEDIDVERPAALVFGNEHAGLTAPAQALCDRTFGIPMYGFTRSFNLSVSVAISVHRTATRRRAAIGRAGDLPDQERARLRARWYELSVDSRTVEGILQRVSRGTPLDVGE
jgi:tRNA (guanosine-2'-O-)-methyltransferase